jgi:hypothetical protein
MQNFVHVRVQGFKITALDFKIWISRILNPKNFLCFQELSSGPGGENNPAHRAGGDAAENDLVRSDVHHAARFRFNVHRNEKVWFLKNL